ncbi:hypothetical protein FACS18949_13060 [Clostridia bacterium]|nr:hypothetical protein FACS189425_04260 [Clostridia bacterium]GHV35321.1 hypothetical protein FACS18949_13060 [Clostridia bacterium]
MLSFYLSALSSPSDRDLFEELYRTHKIRMHYIAFRILGDTELAENIVHDTFITVIEQFEKFSSKSCPENRSLIDIIVRRKAVNELNKSKRNIYVEDVEIEERVGVDEDVISRDGYERLLTEIGKLDEIYSSILLLRYVHEFSEKQAAELLGITGETARKRLIRARNLLKKALEGELV